MSQVNVHGIQVIDAHSISLRHQLRMRAEPIPCTKYWSAETRRPLAIERLYVSGHLPHFRPMLYIPLIETTNRVRCTQKRKCCYKLPEMSLATPSDHCYSNFKVSPFYDTYPILTPVLHLSKHR